MQNSELAEAARAATRAADRARAEIMPRFRHVAVETKSDGTPVTEADRAAERAIREVLREATPDWPVLGEEYGEDGAVGGSGPEWIVDPIDGTLSFSRGLPLFATLIALRHGGESVLGLIDLPALGERLVGWRGAGCRRNGEPVRCSKATDLRRTIVAHGDAICFEMEGRMDAFLEMNRRIPFFRGYTDAFGHAQVLSGSVGAMVDLHLSPWDAAATQVLAVEAGGACRTLPMPSGKIGLVFGSPPLVEQLEALLLGRAD